MPHVSPHKLNTKTITKIQDTLFSAFTSRNIPQKRQRAALEELLTDTEKVMLSKRVVAVSLLERGETSYRISQILHMSITTVTKLQQRLSSGRMKNTSYVCKTLAKGPLQQYIEQLFKPLPRYGTSPSALFKEK